MTQLLAMDWAYLALRAVLAATAAAAAAAAFRYSFRSYPQRGGAWLLSGIAGVFLGMVTILTVYDAIDNLVLRPHDPITTASWLWLLFVDLPMPILAFLLFRTRRQRDRLLAELSRLSVTDQLTGLLNRRGFMETATLSTAQSRRTGMPAAVLMLDIDHFKSINDNYGHAVGDTVLQDLAAALSVNKRAGDIVGRLGGEEFAVLLFASTIDEGITVADRLRMEITRTVPHPGAPEKSVTVSGGVATIAAAHEPESALVQALNAADEALYVAKREGRDRIAVAAPVLTAQAGG